MQSNLIAQNIKIILSEINTIAEKKVKLIAVSKKKPLAMIEQAFDTGISDFGENFAQELKRKPKRVQRILHGTSLALYNQIRSKILQNIRIGYIQLKEKK